MTTNRISPDQFRDQIGGLFSNMPFGGSIFQYTDWSKADLEEVLALTCRNLNALTETLQYHADRHHKLEAEAHQMRSDIAAIRRIFSPEKTE